jgi:hypothetical protein
VTPERLGLFLIEDADASIEQQLAHRLREVGFDVRSTGSGDASVEIDRLRSTFAIIGITGSAADAPREKRAKSLERATARLLAGRRVVEPSYAVTMSGVPVSRDVEGVGSVELDSDGVWLDRVVAMLLAMGWLA